MHCQQVYRAIQAGLPSMNRISLNQSEWMRAACLVTTCEVCVVLLLSESGLARLSRDYCLQQLFLACSLLAISGLLWPAKDEVI